MDKPFGEFTLRPYQKEAAIDFLYKRKVINALCMGVGKSLVGLASAKIIQEINGNQIKVICPASLKDNWLEEAERANIDLEVFSSAKIPDSFNGPFTLICDEAHQYMSITSQRTQAMLNLANQTDFLLLLSGTPMKGGRPRSLFPLLSACRHSLAEKRKEYEVRYCNGHLASFRGRRIWDNSGTSNLLELREKTQDIIFRKPKEECLNLPKFTRVYRNIEVSKEGEHEYKQALLSMKLDYEKRIKEGEISENDALVLLGHLRKAGSMIKAKYGLETIQDLLEEGSRILISCEFLEPALFLAKELRCPSITSKTPVSDRQPIVNSFQAGEWNALVITGQTGGVGLNLYTGDTVILVDRPWTSDEVEQIEARVYRSGCTNPVLSMWFQYELIDTKIDSMVETKAQAISKVLSGKRKTLKYTNALDILKDLLKE